MLEATGSELIEIPPEVCEKTAEQYEHHDAGRGSADWAAYLRMLDTIDRAIGTSDAATSSRESGRQIS